MRCRTSSGPSRCAERARAQEPRSLALLTLVADTHSQNGLALSWEGRQREAEAEMTRAADLIEPAILEYPNDTRVSGGLWSVYWVTSTVYEEQDDRKSHLFAGRALDVARASGSRPGQRAGPPASGPIAVAAGADEHQHRPTR